MAPNRIQEHPNDGTWEPGRVELNGCQTLKAPQHVNKPTKAGRVHFSGPPTDFLSHRERLKIK